MTHELEQNKKLDEEFKMCLQEIQPYVTDLKWTKSGIYEVIYGMFLQ